MKKHTDQKARPDAYVPAHCPLELYSLDPLRVEKALCTLWDDWVRSKGTINMLRIFVNGKALDPDQVNVFRLCSWWVLSPTLLPNSGILS